MWSERGPVASWLGNAGVREDGSTYVAPSPRPHTESCGLLTLVHLLKCPKNVDLLVYVLSQIGQAHFTEVCLS